MKTSATPNTMQYRIRNQPMRPIISDIALVIHSSARITILCPSSWLPELLSRTLPDNRRNGHSPPCQSGPVPEVTSPLHPPLRGVQPFRTDPDPLEPSPAVNVSKCSRGAAQSRGPLSSDRRKRHGRRRRKLQ